MYKVSLEEGGQLGFSQNTSYPDSSHTALLLLLDSSEGRKVILYNNEKSGCWVPNPMGGEMIKTDKHSSCRLQLLLKKPLLLSPL